MLNLLLNIKKAVCLTIVFVAVSCNGKEMVLGETNEGQEELDKTELKNFAKVESSGKYCFLANRTNEMGAGETVSIPTTYYIAKYAVTCAEWSEYIRANNIAAPKYWTDTNAPKGRENHPVVWISCEQAEEYCAWLSRNSDKWNYRLPTEAEWEYAAVGEVRSVYPWGNEARVVYDGSSLESKLNYNGVVASDVLKNPDRKATYNHAKSERYGEKERIGDIISISNQGGVKGWVNHAAYTGFIYTDIFSEINKVGGNTCAVDAYEEGKSWCGCYNMSGNCWEWTTTIGIANNGAEKNQEVNMVRGGSWYATLTSCKASFRGEGRKASGTYNTIGFRLVATPKLP